MNAHVAMVCDAHVVQDLESVLGPEAIATLLDAFSAELATRPTRIAREVASGDLVAARASAHALKGAALVVGASAIATLAGRIEAADLAAARSLTRDLMALAGIARPA